MKALWIRTENVYFLWHDPCNTSMSPLTCDSGVTRLCSGKLQPWPVFSSQIHFLSGHPAHSPHSMGTSLAGLAHVHLPCSPASWCQLKFLLSSQPEQLDYQISHKYLHCKEAICLNWSRRHRLLLSWPSSHATTRQAWLFSSLFSHVIMITWT